MSAKVKTVGKVALVAVAIVMPGGFPLLLVLGLLRRSSRRASAEWRIEGGHWQLP